jgi:hypothetical protein
MMWGWPHKFTRRMEKAGSTVIMLGPVEQGEIGKSGIDTLDQLKVVPKSFAGYVWTNRVKLIGPALREQRRQTPRPFSADLGSADRTRAGRRSHRRPSRTRLSLLQSGRSALRWAA